MEQYKAATNDAFETITNKYDLDPTFIAEMREIFACSGQKHFPSARAGRSSNAAGSSSSATGSRTRRKTGYNMYIKQQFAAIKAAASEAPVADAAATAGTRAGNSQELMSRFSREWKLLAADKRQEYEDVAAKENVELGALPKAAPSSVRGRKKVSGYNIFYRDNKDSIKESLTEGERLMAKVGAMWTTLSAEEKAEYNNRAVEECKDSEAAQPGQSEPANQ